MFHPGDVDISALTPFLTAPWSLGVLYRTLRGRSSALEVYVAACLWMFSASWCYDLYILLRDGSFPVTWSANIAASSVLYACAGLMWNLDWREGRGVSFAFMLDDWPRAPVAGVGRRLAPYALPYAILVAAMIVPFVLDHMGWW